MGKRNPVVVTAAEAVATIADGAVVGIGGFVTTNKPMALLRQLMRAGRRNLTLVATTGSLEIDMFIATGQVGRLITPYVGAEAIAPIAPLFAAHANVDVAVEEIDLGTLHYMLRCQAMGLPYLPLRGPVGTSLVDLNPRLKTIADPFGGPDLVAAPPLALDVALIHAYQSDPYGNVQHCGATFLDEIMARAARRVVVQVERLVTNEEIRKAPRETTLPAALVDQVVVAPYGAHPFASQNVNRLDAQHLQEFVQVCKAGVRGDRAGLDAYMQRYVTGTADQEEYLAAVGFSRIFSLALVDGGERS